MKKEAKLQTCQKKRLFSPLGIPFPVNLVVVGAVHQPIGSIALGMCRPSILPKPTSSRQPWGHGVGTGVLHNTKAVCRKEGGH